MAISMNVLAACSLGTLCFAALAACGGKESSRADSSDASPSHDAGPTMNVHDAPSSPSDVVASVDVNAPMPEGGLLPCAAPGIAPGGNYYMSCLPKALPTPFAFWVTLGIMMIPDGTDYVLGMTLTPLKVSATSLIDTVPGTFNAPTTMFGGDCTFTQKIGTFTLPAGANSLNRDLRFDGVVLRGKLLSPERGCTELDGVVNLIMLSLEGDGDICMLFRVQDLTAPLPLVEDYICPPDILPPR
jgi:hypothetical protein